MEYIHIDPPEPEPITCEECPNWEECPCECGYGWCSSWKEFTHCDDDCN